MAKYADLDRRRQEHILVNQHALHLAIEALARLTRCPVAQWAKEVSARANEHVDKCNDVQIEAVIDKLDKDYG